MSSCVISSELPSSVGSSDFVKEKELVVQTLSSYPEMNSSIKMEVGIEDCLHIEFEYNKSKYHLKRCDRGKNLLSASSN